MLSYQELDEKIKRGFHLCAFNKVIVPRCLYLVLVRSLKGGGNNKLSLIKGAFIQVLNCYIYMLFTVYFTRVVIENMT